MTSSKVWNDSMIVVTGGNGQLASCLKDRLSKNSVFLEHRELDISDKKSVASTLSKYSPTIIINCAAYTQVDKAESEPAQARKCNVTGPQVLAQYCKENHCKLIHISTDYVFDGLMNKPYKESDSVDPQGVYGKSKYEGEKAITETGCMHAIIRTSWLYSEYGKNFIKTMSNLTSSKHELSVVFDQVGSPTYAGDLADTILSIATQINDNNSGIYHYCNQGITSWFDLTIEINELLKNDCKVNAIESEEYPTAARRPHYSVLNTKKLRDTFNINIPHWKESLKKCLQKLS